MGLKQVVLFDLDGTLVEFPREHLFQTTIEVCQQLGIHPPTELEMLRHFTAFDFFAAIPSDHRDSFAEFLARELERKGHPPLRPFAHTISTLKALKERGHELAIATARVVPVAQLQTELNDSGLGEYFAHVVTRYGGSQSWTDKQPQITELCRKFDRKAAEVCFIGDIPADVTTAYQSGVRQVIAVLSGGIDRTVLLQAKPLHLLEDIAELLSL